jgi:hypothetical protein
MFPIESALKLYVDSDGNPLDGGYIYFGSPNQNPITAPVTVYWDSAGTQPAAQPLRTQNGYIVRNGTPANVFYSNIYSQLVQDSRKIQIYYAPTSADYSIGNIFTSIGASLIGFIQSGSGAVAGTVQEELRRHVWAEQFGAVGDGVTINSTAFLNAKNRVAAGGTLEIGPGTFLINSDTALLISAANITIKGQRGSTILKAANGANLSSIIAFTGTGGTLRDIILDGNRDNGGIATNFYILNVAASGFLMENCEVRFGVGIGMFIGHNVTRPTDIRIDKSKFYSNGGSVNGGIGVGIYGGGTATVNGLKITNCWFEDNYCTFPGFPGDSTAMNIVGTDITVDFCTLINNHNVQGGQIALSSDQTDGAAEGRFIISNTHIRHTTAIAGEATTAIEIAGRNFHVHHCICESMNGDGVRLELSGGDGIVDHNVITCTANGVNLITVSGTGIRRSIIDTNQILNASVGVSVQAGAEVTSISVLNNWFNGAIPTKIAGLANCTFVRGNMNYAIPSVAGLVAGPSPYNFPKLNFDAVYTVETLNGINGIIVDGIAMSILQRVPIFVSAQEQLTVTWAGSAPVFNYNAVQGGG